jgi:hypothetical protein
VAIYPRRSFCMAKSRGAWMNGFGWYACTLN